MDGQLDEILSVLVLCVYVCELKRLSVMDNVVSEVATYPISILAVTASLVY